MPRIPQSEFDTNPSTRVGAPSARLAPDALNNVGKELGNLAKAAALLQDQSERTEAYDYANRVKQDYLHKKASYAAALETVNGSGVADYFDPTDSNPDISKRRRIQRPIHEMYQEMVGSYEESKKGLNNVTRSDIAGDLMRGYVGDDLIQLQLNTNKHINQVREKETKARYNENMELNVLNFAETAMAPDATPEAIMLGMQQMKNKMARERGYIGNVLGGEEAANLQKLEDRTYAQFAASIFSSGVNNNTIAASEGLVKMIRDPSTRGLAMTRIENAKKAAAEVKAITALNSTIDTEQTLVAAPALTIENKVKAVAIAKNLANAYIDPKYTPGLTDEMRNEKVVSLLSTTFAKDILQNNLEDPEFVDAVDSLASGSRAPSGDIITDAKRAKLDQQIAQELEASGVGSIMGNKEGIIAAVRTRTLDKMRSLRSTMQDHVADIVEAKYPNLQGREKVEKIHQIAAAQGFGDPVLVSKKQQGQFKAAFQTEMAKDPVSALNVLNQELFKAGEAYEGEGSYMAFVIPLADAEYTQQIDMIRDAAAYKQVIENTDVTQNDFKTNFGLYEGRIPALQSLLKSNPSVDAGVKQAIINRAAAKVGSSGKSAINGAMEEAIEDMKGLYTSIDHGRSTLLGVNRTSKNYGKVSKMAIEKGTDKVLSLPNLSYQEKEDLFRRQFPQLIGKKENGEWNPTPPEDKLNWWLQRELKVEPDGRFPGVHVVKTNNGAIVHMKGRVVKYSMDDIVKYGEEEREKTLKSFGRK
jgi:hypothetical protein